MKEILKFLRRLNNYSQDQIASLIGVSRQSYSKYENGSVTPSEQTVNTLAEIYKVAPSYFYEGRIPSNPEQFLSTPAVPGKSKNSFSNPVESSAVPNKSADFYHINEDENSLKVAEPAVSFKPEPDGDSTQNSWDVYFDGNTLRLADNSKAHFSKGQRFKLVEIDKETQRKKQALENINIILQEIPPYNGEYDDDPFYKKAIQRRIEEKYGFTD